MNLISYLDCDEEIRVTTPEQNLYCAVIERAIDDIQYYMTIYLTPSASPDFLLNRRKYAYCSKPSIDVFAKLKEMAVNDKVLDFSSAKLAAELSYSLKYLQLKVKELEDQGVIESEYVLRSRWATNGGSRYIRNIILLNIPSPRLLEVAEAQSSFAVTETEFKNAVNYIFGYQDNPYYSIAEHLNYIFSDEIKTDHILQKIRELTFNWIEKDERVIDFFIKKYPRTISKVKNLVRDKLTRET
jgi:hypothetical protein